MSKSNTQDMEIKALLGSSTEFKGLLSFEGAVRIDGKLEGEVISKDTLVVGEKAILSADITIGTIFISGKVTGNISASIRVEIKKTGEVLGNIKSPTLLIEEGAIFDGHCNMVKKEKKVAVLHTNKDKHKKKEISLEAAVS